MQRIYEKFYMSILIYKDSGRAINQLNSEEIESLLQDDHIKQYFGKRLKQRLLYLKTKLGKLFYKDSA